MRNVLNIFRNDLRAMYKHFFAFLVILAICILPALYAWFNIYAYDDPYERTSGINLAVVNLDTDYINSDGEIINIGKELVAGLEEEDSLNYVFLDDKDAAIEGVYSGEYYAALVIDPDFTYNMYNFLTTDMFQPTISFYQNEKRNPIAVKVVEAASEELTRSVNAKFIDTIVQTLFGKLNGLSSDVSGDSTADMVKDALVKINGNLSSYSASISSFINANNALIETLNQTNSTLNYSIFLIGNERVNISDQIVYTENTQKDLALINSEVNTMLLSLQDSVDEAIYKLDRLYQGDTSDQQAAVTALAELERQYRELIDYIKNSGITGTDVDDALSALNTLAEKITELRQKLGMTPSNGGNSSAQVQAMARYNDEAINAVGTDFNTVAVPSVYEAMTGYKYEDLTNPSASTQSLESMMDFMAADTSNRIDSINANIQLANSSTGETRNSALQSIKTDTNVLYQELDAMQTASQAMETASNSDTSVSSSVGKAATSAKSAKDIADDILNGNRDIDLVRDLQLISEALSVTRVTLTEVVYPALDTMLENLQDTMGDISSLMLELGDVLGKASPIVGQLGNTFGAVNKALIQVQDLLGSFSDRISSLINTLETGENEWLDSVLEFFDIDPESIGAYLSEPVSVDSRTVFPVKNYGSAMAPFYTMLAIWVGCIIINSIVRMEKPVTIENVTDTEAFFGRYLVVFLISQIQTFIIILGDLLLLNVQCLHPGLMFLTGFVTSLVCSMIAYALTTSFGNIGKFLFVVIMILQIAGSGGSYPIEILPNFFQQVYLFFPFPYAIDAMRECIAGLYGSNLLIKLLELMLFFVAALFIGLVVRRYFKGLNQYMDEQLEETEMI